MPFILNFAPVAMSPGVHLSAIFAIMLCMIGPYSSTTGLFLLLWPFVSRAQAVTACHAVVDLCPVCLCRLCHDLVDTLGTTCGPRMCTWDDSSSSRYHVRVTRVRKSYVRKLAQPLSYDQKPQEHCSQPAQPAQPPQPHPGTGCKAHVSGPPARDVSRYSILWRLGTPFAPMQLLTAAC